MGRNHQPKPRNGSLRFFKMTLCWLVNGNGKGHGRQAFNWSLVVEQRLPRDDLVLTWEILIEKWCKRVLFRFIRNPHYYQLWPNFGAFWSWCLPPQLSMPLKLPNAVFFEIGSYFKRWTFFISTFLKSLVR